MTNDIDTEWRMIKQKLPIRTRIRCRVKSHWPFGVFASIDDCPFDGLIQITDFKDADRMSPEQYPPLDTVVEAVVLGFKETGKQIWLGVKPSQLSKSLDASESHRITKIVTIGLRIVPEKGLEAFGSDEVNSYLKSGGTVVAITNEKAIIVKVDEDNENVRLRLGGVSYDIVMEINELRGISTVTPE